MSLKIDWCSNKAAKYAVEHWHYSKTMPRFKLVKIGVWENDKFIGVVIFSPGASSNLLRSYSLDRFEGCELTRVALTEHEATVSKIVSIAIKMLKKANPKLRLIVSFADPMEKHLGGIYQAGNWIYSGVTANQRYYIDKNGRRWHSRNVSEKGYVKIIRYEKAPKISEMAEVIKMCGKFRYLYPLDKKMRKQIESLRQPYPK